MLALPNADRVWDAGGGGRGVPRLNLFITQTLAADGAVFRRENLTKHWFSRVPQASPSGPVLYKQQIEIKDQKPDQHFPISSICLKNFFHLARMAGAGFPDPHLPRRPVKWSMTVQIKLRDEDVGSCVVPFRRV
jgi:hypothetical protein